MCLKSWYSHVFAASDAFDLTNTLCGNRLLQFVGLNQWNSEKLKFQKYRYIVAIRNDTSKIRGAGRLSKPRDSSAKARGMEQNELFVACRHGNLDKLKILVEERDVELNIRDMWDSTPLYYACLCGHTDVVRYLLEQGARCDADTFDGERCLYGALTNDIRQLLLQHKAITSQTIRRNQYEEFLRLLLENHHYADVAFEVHGQHFAYHRCVLAARSEYFREQFAGKWRNRDVIRNNHPLVDPTAFRAVLSYIYTGRLEVNVSLVDDCLLLAKQFRLDTLYARLSKEKNNAKFFVKTKFLVKTKFSTIVIEPQVGLNELHFNFGNLALQTLPKDLQYVYEPEVNSPFPEEPRNAVVGGADDDNWKHLADVVFSVGDAEFHCHKAFVCNRSEYLRALVSDHFHESKVNEAGVPIVELHNISVSTFVAIIFFMYQDFATVSVENVMDVVATAEEFFLPGLKKLCGAVIAENLDSSCVLPVLKTARVLRLPRLETACIEYIANNLEASIRDPALSDLIVEDANEVKNREDTDTIDIIDDIRYFISNNVQTFSQLEEAHEKLTLIDDLLEEIGLDA
ncbi:hypothetical protein RvY_04105 [Ramazzottius varieornatus]|uniref:BTB domain-containing protein n=1 Tax=Ramazzottius varieornatus TaxID=947166 RepID=A0A1D1UQF0_RAMVA|nr:hypothetical protein RvY_04105 [Ramazzottius varieornatus]